MEPLDAPAEPGDRPPTEAERQPVAAVPVPQGLGPAWLRGLLLLPAVVVLVNVAALVVHLAVVDTATLAADALFLLSSVLLVLVAVPATLAAWRWASRRPIVELGHGGPPARALRGVLLGALSGVLLMAGVVGLGAAAGAWSVALATPRPAALLGFAVLLLAASYGEELMFRGFVLQEMGRRRLTWGLVASSLLFAVAHLANPGATSAGATAFALAMVNIVLAGLLLGLVFLRSGGLWWPWGLHFGWNWAQGCLFGIPVSGFALPSVLATTPGEAPAWLDGGAFGAEASALATVVLVAGAALVAAGRRRSPLRLPSEPPRECRAEGGRG